MELTSHLEPGIVGNLRELGGEDLLRRLLSLMLELAPQHLRTMRQALGDGDLESAQRAAHALRSTAGTVGAARLLEGCRQAEEAAGVDEGAVILRDLEESWRELEPALVEYLG